MDFQENVTLSKLSETQKDVFLSRCNKLRVLTTSCCMNRSYTRISAANELKKGNILIAAFFTGMIAVFAGIAVARFIQTKMRRRRAFSHLGSIFYIFIKNYFLKLKSHKKRLRMKIDQVLIQQDLVSTFLLKILFYLAKANDNSRRLHTIYEASV